jgi:hypothetical protein
MKAKDKMEIIGRVEIILTNVKSGKTKYQKTHNLVTDVGKEAIADALRGTITDNRGIVTYCALGTDNTAPNRANTALGNELSRKLVSVRSVDGNEALFETFFTTEEGNGTLKEAGLFGDNATNDKDSGTLFCHTAISRTKTSADTLTLRWSVEIG